MSSEEIRDNNGRFPKGVSGNLAGRPKGSGKKKLDPTILHEIYQTADGDPIRFQELVLKNGHKLALDLNTALRLAKELSPYREAKKASVEVKQDTTKTFLILDPTKSLPSGNNSLTYNLPDDLLKAKINRENSIKLIENEDLDQ